MDGAKFDGIARKLAQHRLSRRTAIESAGAAGLVAAFSRGIGTSQAQDEATPEAADSENLADVMFVQGYSSGSLTPIADNSATFDLTLEEGLGQTVWFADRPSRDFGSVNTDDFVEGFNFSDENPPNAALVTNVDGEEEILIVELMTPAYDTENRSMTFVANVLGGFDQDESGQLMEPEEIEPEPQNFGVTHLFIDSCSDAMVQCCQSVVCDETTARCSCSSFADPVGPAGYCWNWGRLACLPCDSDHWTEVCNSAHPDECEGGCTSWPQSSY